MNSTNGLRIQRSQSSDTINMNLDPDSSPNMDTKFALNNDLESARPLSSPDQFPVESTDALAECVDVAVPARRFKSPVAPAVEPLDSDNEDGPLESLPTELLQNIATFISSDVDLGQLFLSAPERIGGRLNADNSDIWQRRFLARYDYPILSTGTDEFAVAYKLRRFVLRKLDGRALANGDYDKAEHQLQVLNDMVLETYNKCKAHLPQPKNSKNLAAMSSPDSSPWITSFMGCALYGNQRSRHGRPNLLFDLLQVTLSHLVLNQRSPVMLVLPSSRENYDLGRVYNYNKPLTMLLARLPAKARPKSKPFRSKRFPNLKCPASEVRQPQYRLNIHDVLHIRNFWQRHFADESQGNGESTYAPMVRQLVALGKVPQKWDVPLQDFVPLKTEWIGHYSSLTPWPKNKQDLYERQSCAEDWETIDPMTLELETSSRNDKGAFWPPVFSSIPVFQEAMPDNALGERLHLTYIRGISPFSQLEYTSRRHSHPTKGDVREKRTKWHPFLSSRVHGFVHDIAKEDVLGRKVGKVRYARNGEDIKEDGIPGWRRICMIIYKPTTRQLVSVLEHAAEDYGGMSGTQMTFNTANVWATGDDAQGGPGENIGGQNDAVNATTPPSNSSDQAGEIEVDDDGHPTEGQIEASLRKILTERIEQFSQEYKDRVLEASKATPTESMFTYGLSAKRKAKAPLPALFSAQHIRLLEEDFSGAEYTTWDDGSIEYAYGYEGIIIPGGKIMMGRYWRIHGADGMGVGKEVDPDGKGVEVRVVLQAEENGGEEGDEERSGSSGTRLNKRKRTKKGWKKRKQRKRKHGSRGGMHGFSSDEDKSEEQSGSEADEDGEVQDRAEEREREREYVFVTMVQGEESRAVNASKGLERGPFVFWAT